MQRAELVLVNGVLSWQGGRHRYLLFPIERAGPDLGLNLAGDGRLLVDAIVLLGAPVQVGDVFAEVAPDVVVEGPQLGNPAQVPVRVLRWLHPF